jgi:hypothetical protein
MAGGVIVPILIELEPYVKNILLKLFDKLFPPKSGPIKFPLSVTWVQALIDAEVKAGKWTAGQIPDQPTIAGWLQALVNDLNAKGELKGKDTVVPGIDPNLPIDPTTLLAKAVETLQWVQTMPGWAK